MTFRQLQHDVTVLNCDGLMVFAEGSRTEGDEAAGDAAAGGQEEGQGVRAVRPCRHCHQVRKLSLGLFQCMYPSE